MKQKLKLFTYYLIFVNGIKVECQCTRKFCLEFVLERNTFPDQPERSLEVLAN